MSTYLIAEDDVLHRGFLREVIALGEIDCEHIIEAENGEDAIRLAREHDLKGVILDLQMPRKTGVQAASSPVGSCQGSTAGLVSEGSNSGAGAEGRRGVSTEAASPLRRVGRTGSAIRRPG